ncbi:MAG: hypothetical protein WCT77_12765 [Bacteroidota bacterium]
MKYAVVALLFLVNTFFAFADDPQKGVNPKANPEIPKHKVTVKYMKNTYRVYKLTEHTVVNRYTTDSVKSNYERDLTYFLTLGVPDPPDADGFQRLVITIDSLNYKFIADSVKKIDYFTQDESKRPPRSVDFEAISVPMNRTFTFILSPYGEVAKIESEDISVLKDYIEEQGKNLKKKDAMKKFIWTDGLTDSRLLAIADYRKIMLPRQPIEKDTIWKTPISFQIDFKDYSDTLSAKIAEYNGGLYHIEATTNKILPSEKECYFNGVVQTGKVENTEGKGIFKMTINNKGIITRSEADFELINKCKVENETFNEQVTTKMIWDYIGQFTM